MSVENEKPVSIECRFAMHCPSNQSSDDLHVVKEIRHYADGTSKPALKLIKNYKRPFYLTKKGRRNFTQFKEWMDIEDLDRYESTQNTLTESIAKALGKPYFRGSLKDLCASPYIFGADITSTSIIKQSYRDKWDIQTPYLNAVFDTETDVLHGTGKIMMATISCREKVFTCVQKSFVERFPNAAERIIKLADQYIGDVIKERNIKIEVKIVDSEIDIVKECMAKAHAWSPDFLSAWNIEFDMDKLVAACQAAGIEPAYLLSDPSIPAEFRYFKFKKGNAKKLMASGRTLNFKPAQRWHSVVAPASFCWIDAMQAYKQVRTGAPEETSYGLDAILKKEFKDKLGKLKFKEADGYQRLEWHKFMQEHYPLEYVVYNIFDCVGMEMLDEKTMDLRLSLPMFAGCTDFANFNSLPRKTMNELHWICRDLGKVPGSTASEMTDDNDAETTDVKGWMDFVNKSTLTTASPQSEMVE